MSESDEWVTIAEAARRLDIHQRQARRYADRLPEGDRTPAGQSPLCVRMSSLERLRRAGQRTEVRSGTGTGQAGQSRTGVPISAQQIATVYEALIAEKDARIRLLEEDRAMDRRRIAEMEEQLSIAARPEAKAGFPVEQALVVDNGASEQKPVTETIVEAKTQRRRSWLDRLLGRG